MSICDYLPRFDDFFPKTRRGEGRIAPAIDRNGRVRKFPDTHKRHEGKGAVSGQDSNKADWSKERGL